MFCGMESNNEENCFVVRYKQEHSDIGPSAYFAKLGKKKLNKEKEIEKHRK